MLNQNWLIRVGDIKLFVLNAWKLVKAFFQITLITAKQDCIPVIASLLDKSTKETIKLSALFRQLWHVFISQSKILYFPWHNFFAKLNVQNARKLKTTQKYSHTLFFYSMLPPVTVLSVIYIGLKQSSYSVMSNDLIIWVLGGILPLIQLTLYPKFLGVCVPVWSSSNSVLLDLDYVFDGISGNIFIYQCAKQLTQRIGLKLSPPNMQGIYLKHASEFELPFQLFLQNLPTDSVISLANSLSHKQSPYSDNEFENVDLFKTVVHSLELNTMSERTTFPYDDPSNISLKLRQYRLEKMTIRSGSCLNIYSLFKNYTVSLDMNDLLNYSKNKAKLCRKISRVTCSFLRPFTEKKNIM